MRINTIKFENFRCFKEYEVTFAPMTTVLIGKNGTGKTNLLTGLVYALSFPFAKNIVKGMQTIGTSSPDLKIAEIDNKGSFDARYDSEKEDYIYPIKLESTATFDNSPLDWAMVKEKKGGGLSSKLYQQAFEKFQQYFNENSNKKPLPVLAFFSDSFPHIEANFSAYAKSILNSENNPPRNFGYYKWDEKTNCIGIWKELYSITYLALSSKRYYYAEKLELPLLSERSDVYNKMFEFTATHPNYKEWELKHNSLTKELEQIKHKIKEEPEYVIINFIDDRIKKFTEPLRQALGEINKELQVDKIHVVGSSRTEFRLQLTFSDTRKVFFESLPQGYKRLLSIVFDISFRSFILNKTAEPEGIVIIDEVELHLHPTLQQEVLGRFRKTFPKIQFIVSTHSPLVISNLKKKDEYGDNKIIKLTNIKSVYKNDEVDNIYGVDYTTSLMEVMDADYRLSSVDNLIDSYIILKVRKKEGAAQKVWNELFEMVGTDNEMLKKEIETRFSAAL